MADKNILHFTIISTIIYFARISSGYIIWISVMWRAPELLFLLYMITVTIVVHHRESYYTKCLPFLPLRGLWWAHSTASRPPARSVLSPRSSCTRSRTTDPFVDASSLYSTQRTTQWYHYKFLFFFTIVATSHFRVNMFCGQTHFFLWWVNNSWFWFLIG